MALSAREIKEQVRIQDVVDMLGLQLTRSGDALRGPCPSCQSENKRALVVTPGKGAYCFHVKAGGDIFWLVCHIQGCGFKDALTQVQEHFRLAGDPPKPVQAPEPTPEPTGAPLAALQPLGYLIHDHQHVTEIVDAETAEKLGIGFSPKGLMRGLIAIPVRLTDGTLAGYVGVPPGTTVRVPKTWRY